MEDCGAPCTCNTCVDISAIASSGKEETVRSDDGSNEGSGACVNDGSEDGCSTSVNRSNVGRRDNPVGGRSRTGGVACADGRFGTGDVDEFDGGPDKGLDDWSAD